VPELLQEALFEVADIVLLVEQDDAFLVLDFVHAPVGEGVVVVGQQNGVCWSYLTLVFVSFFKIFGSLLKRKLKV